MKCFENLARVVLLIAVVLLLAACAGTDTRAIRSGSAMAVVGSETLPAPDTTIDGRYVGQSDYRVGPLDVLEIAVFQVADLTRTVRINSSGNVSLPLIGTFAAGGKTVQELETEIAQRLRDGFLQDPQVTVYVKEFTSQRITVEGAVNGPGMFPITGQTSLLQAVALAGGMDRLANQRGVIVFRTIAGQRMAAVFDMTEIRAGQAEDPRIYGDDIVVVDFSGARSAWRELIGSLGVISLFTPL